MDKGYIKSDDFYCDGKNWYYYGYYYGYEDCIEDDKDNEDGDDD